LSWANKLFQHCGSYYKDALDLALAITHQHAVTLDGTREQVSVPSLVLNMADAFGVNGPSLRFCLREPENAHFREVIARAERNQLVGSAMAQGGASPNCDRVQASGERFGQVESPNPDDPSCSVAILVKKSAESVDSLDWCRAVEALLGGIRDRYLETNPTMLAGWIAD